MIGYLNSLSVVLYSESLIEVNNKYVILHPVIFLN